MANIPRYDDRTHSETIECLEGRISDLEYEVREWERLNQTPMDCPTVWNISPMVKKLLEIIYSREGIITYGLIFHHLYGSTEDPPLQTIINVYMTRLRKILRTVDAEIITVCGEGYKMPEASKEIIRIECRIK